MFEQLAGLRPQVCLIIGPGYLREEVKALLFTQIDGFTANSVLSRNDFLLQWVGGKKQNLLGAESRIEILRSLLADAHILAHLPKISSQRRKRQFLQRVDQALQQGRMAFAHATEAQVFEERLSQGLLVSSLRQELQILTVAYEAILKANEAWDLPLLFKVALEQLEAGEGATRMGQFSSALQEVWLLSHGMMESLEAQFWDRCHAIKPLRKLKWQESVQAPVSSAKACHWHLWHTLDDASEALALHFQRQWLSLGSSFFAQEAILIPDDPLVRRVLSAALLRHGLPLEDPRDPTALKRDEALKRALLALEVVALRFERKTVVEWLRQTTPDGLPVIQTIAALGIRYGLERYHCQELAAIYPRLKALEERLGGRKTCQQMRSAHLEILREQLAQSSARVGSQTQAHDLEWIAFFEDFWSRLQTDLAWTGHTERPSPVQHWWERVQARLRSQTPVIAGLQPTSGVRIYRIEQAPLSQAKKIWILGLPGNWLESSVVGDLWWSDREREVLAGEFLVRSQHFAKEEKINLLAQWIQFAGEISFLAATFAPDGKEVESLELLLYEMRAHCQAEFAVHPQEQGAQKRFLPSYALSQALAPQTVRLEDLRAQGETPVLSATLVDRMSRCSFQALAYHRWKLADLREPDFEIWPEVRGQLLHEAVRLLMLSWDGAAGGFNLSAEQALASASQGFQLRGLLQGVRLRETIWRQLLKVLNQFLVKEAEYLKRSGAIPWKMEGQGAGGVGGVKETRDLFLRLETPGWQIVGQPDRLDLHPDGVFVIDYKSSSGALPHGSSMLEEGYRLQLAFYGLAARERWPKRVLGLQFIALDPEGGRGHGVFLAEFNGKKTGTLTHVRENSASLMHEPEAVIWDRLASHLHKSAEAYVAGHFQAAPLVAKECVRCRLAILCGRKRRLLQEREEPLEN